MSGRGAAGLALLALLSCGGGGGGASPVVGAKDLGGALAAKVGDDSIFVASVERVARAQAVSPQRARELLVDDAVLASGARSRGIDPWFQVDAALARRLSKSLLAEAEARGDVTDAELDDGTKRYWLDVDRPAATRVAQAVVLADAKSTPDQRAASQTLAERIRDRARALHDLAASTSPPKVSFNEPLAAQLDELAQAFRTATNEVPRGQIKLTWEVDPPIADDNRMLAPEGADAVPEFTKEMASLRERGDVKLFSTRFGIHVVLLLEKTPAAQFSREERRKKLRDVTIKDRARAAELELLAKLREQASIERHAEGMLADVVVSQ
jgi:hypothetical protein